MSGVAALNPVAKIATVLGADKIKDKLSGTLGYTSSAKKKSSEATAQAASDSADAAAELEESRKRTRNSLFQTEGTGGVLTNSVSARQSYFGN